MDSISLNVLIVEDEIFIAEMLSEMLIDLGQVVAARARNFEEALYHLETKPSIDIVFLDINLNAERDGIDVGMQIKNAYKKPFLYITSYSDKNTVRKASLTKPDAYLLKPFTKNSIFSNLELITAKRQFLKPLYIKEKGFETPVYPSQIIYIKSDNNYLEIFTLSKKYIHRSSLENFLTVINSTFIVRSHRSYAINKYKLESIKGNYVMVSGVKIPVSRKYKSELLENL